MSLTDVFSTIDESDILWSDTANDNNAPMQLVGLGFIARDIVTSMFDDLARR